jgi:hypothetical protein
VRRLVFRAATRLGPTPSGLGRGGSGHPGVDTACLPPCHPPRRQRDLSDRTDRRVGQRERAHSESDPFLRYVRRARCPPPPLVPLTLIHGDFQSANLIVSPDGAWSVVDWEFARIGDPARTSASSGAWPPASPDHRGGCARVLAVTELTGLTESSSTHRHPLSRSCMTTVGTDPREGGPRPAALPIGSFYVANAVSYAHTAAGDHHRASTPPTTVQILEGFRQTPPEVSAGLISRSRCWTTSCPPRHPAAHDCVDARRGRRDRPAGRGGGRSRHRSALAAYRETDREVAPRQVAYDHAGAVLCRRACPDTNGAVLLAAKHILQIRSDRNGHLRRLEHGLQQGRGRSTPITSTPRRS